MLSIARTFAPGVRARPLGLLATGNALGSWSPGVRVRVAGSALERQIFRPMRVRARPWSARLAPWCASGWEHSLAPTGSTESVETVLREARCPRAAGTGPLAPAALLAQAIWVEVEGETLREGSGDLRLSVASAGGLGESIEAVTTLQVRTRTPATTVTAYATWCGALAERAGELGALFGSLGRWLNGNGGTARVFVAEGLDREQLTLRPGCVVADARGWHGDARWRSLWKRVEQGSIEQIALRPPDDRSRGSDAVLVLARRAGFEPGPIELQCSLPLDGLTEPGVACRSLVEILAKAAPEAGFVALHPWAPGVLDCTRVGGDPVRTLARLGAEASDTLAIWPREGQLPKRG